MPKHVVKDRAGRGVRWTLEVSADVQKDAARAAKAGSTGSKRKPTARGAKTPMKKDVAARSASRKQMEPAVEKKMARKKRPQEEPRAEKPSAPAAVVATAQTPVERPVPGAGSAPVAALARTNSPASSTTSPRMIAIAVGAVLVVGALLLARDPARQLSPTVNAQPSTSATTQNAEMPLSQEDRVMRRAEPVTTRAAVESTTTPRSLSSRVGDSPAMEKSQSREVHSPAMSPSTPVTPAAVAPASSPAAPSREPEVKPTPVAATLSASAAGPSTTSDHAAEAPVSLTGCLEAAADGDRFRLTDVEGADVPKTRGWRSGFLKKRPAPVDLVSPPAALAHKYVGYRVVATGSLESRELRVRSLQSMGSLCD